MGLTKPVIFAVIAVVVCGVLAVYATNSSNNDISLTTLNLADTTVHYDNGPTEDNAVQQEPVNQKEDHQESLNQNEDQVYHTEKRKQEWIVCQECGGTGVCWGCDGTGMVVDPEFFGDNESHVCPVCEGSLKCPACQGTGMEPANQWTGTYPG